MGQFFFLNFSFFSPSLVSFILFIFVCVLTLEIHLLIKTTNSFTFICIYFLWHLFPGHKFLFLQFLLGYLFLLCSLLFWFRSNLFFFSKDHLSVAGRAHGGVDPTVSSVSPASHLGGLVHLDVLNDHLKPHSSQLLILRPLI